MPQSMSRDALVDRIARSAGERRLVVAIAGSPGSGKSTLAEWLRDRLNAEVAGRAEILPMDGFHYDDAILNARGHRPRKGAPHTFDVDGLAVTLDRLRADDGREVAVPVFDRTIEIARAGARIIGPSARILLVEGNYLLLDDPRWIVLRPRFDLSAMLDVPEAVLRERLTRRWIDLGLSGDALAAKLDGNDFPNMRLVLTQSRPADHLVFNG
ncbi:nucleoside triphosphate hydrolase [Aurantimonas sp. MSK8Z-1]|uniref:nucleoside triphosphate hydrolase n=1 Tax=Mangrovibrevibacter kandeliae TaxID=2968473 RepID=UPI002118E538|nr:nucleoside triphosphate hydrolase [Aurantimonas sp. MSK8Z-1]MCW4116184.1 nucleoside triphosphate hydrolase [Aurantimonas sp. MSK8Z-1]